MENKEAEKTNRKKKEDVVATGSVGRVLSYVAYMEDGPSGTGIRRVHASSN